MLKDLKGQDISDVIEACETLNKVSAEKGYQGRAVVCSVTYQPLAGHRPSRYAIKYLMEQRDMEIWLVPLDNTRIMVPFRIVVPTLIGAAVLEATQFVNAALPSRASGSNTKTQ